MLYSGCLAFSPVPRKVSQNNFWDFVGTNRNDLDGVYINKNKIKGYDNIPKIKDSKHNPPNCNTVVGALYHEVGHNFDYEYNLADEQEIRDLYQKEVGNYNKYRKLVYKKGYSRSVAFQMLNSNPEKPKDFTSEYAFVDKNLPQNDPDRYREFIAENISEYLTSQTTATTPSPTAVRVWNILIKKINAPKVVKK